MNGANTANEYVYDANGNLNKNITDIQYNFLNLPSQITFDDGSTIVYLYSADGTKLRTMHNINGTVTKTDYCGNVIYENDTATQLLTEAGYVSLSDNQYHYYLQDHQGNNRVVVDKNGTPEETNNYYPFGGVFASTGNIQPYKYNGKELDNKKGLNWYDYGARHYDAALRRFMTIDPMVEKYYNVAPYAYVGNNPIKLIDPDGKDWRIATEYNQVKHKIEYKITVNAVLYNNSDNANINMEKLSAAIQQQVNDTYNISGKDFEVKMNFNLRIASSVDEIGDNDHVFQVVNQADLGKSPNGIVQGKASTPGLNIKLGDIAVNNLLSGEDKRTAAHELGHTGGLHDLREDKYADNLMMQSYLIDRFGKDNNKSTKLDRNQIETIRDNYINNKLNQNSPKRSEWFRKYLVK